MFIKKKLYVWEFYDVSEEADIPMEADVINLCVSKPYHKLFLKKLKASYPANKFVLDAIPSQAPHYLDDKRIYFEDPKCSYNLLRYEVSEESDNLVRTCGTYISLWFSKETTEELADLIVNANELDGRLNQNKISIRLQRELQPPFTGNMVIWGAHKGHPIWY